MKKINKIMSLVICVILCLSCFSSCGENVDDNNNSNDSSSVDSVIDSTNSDANSQSNDSDTSNDDNKTNDKSKDKNSKTSKNKNDSSSAGSNDDDLSGLVAKSYSIDTLKDPNASDEDKAYALQLILSKAASDGAETAGNVPGGEKIKDKLNNNSSNSNKTNNNSNKTNNKDTDKKDNTASNNTDKNDKNDNDSSQATTPNKPNKTPVKLTGDEKTFVITVYPNVAPKTAQNFLDLVDEGFYNGMEFNRVIENFLAQAGDEDGNGSGTSDKTIQGEFKNNGFNNTLSHLKGVVSMNRKPENPNSATSQFFICYNDECKFMDGNYAAFGKVTEGWNVVEDFQNIESVTGKDGTKSKPVSPISIKLAENIGKDSSGNPKVKFYVTY